MKCPKCNQGEVREQISIKGFIFFKKKEIYIYCPLCDFENKKTFKLSPDDLKFEREKLTIQNQGELLKAKNYKESKYYQTYEEI